MMKQTVNVLLIEDNPGDVGLLKELLRESDEFDFQIQSAETLKGGLALSEKCNSDVILLDLSLPDSKGLKTLDKVRKASHGKPIIVLTGNSDLSVSKQAIQDGAQDFLIKGRIDSDILIRSIMYALQRFGLETKIIAYSERLRKAQKVGHTGSWEIDLRTNAIWGSEEALNIYGIPYADASSPLVKVQQLPLAEFRPTLDNALRDLIQQKAPYDLEFKIKRANDGRIRWLHSVAELTLDNTGAPHKVCGVIQDITEKKEAEERLHSSERLYKLIAENSKDVIWTMDLTGKFTYISPSVHKLRGYTPEEILPQTPEEIISPGSLQIVRKTLDEHFNAIREGRHFTREPYEIEQPRKDGTSVWTEVLSSDLTDEEGKIIGIIGVSRNIDERKRMQDQLHESEQRFWDMFNNAPFGYHELDKEGRIVQVNQTELDLLQYSREEMVGSFVWNYLSDPELSKNRVLAKLRGEIPPGKGTERKYKLKNGGLIPLMVEDRVIKDTAGNITGMRSATQDITDRKKTENEVIKLSMAVEQSPASIVITNIGGDIEYVNHTFTKTTGYAIDEVLHKNPRVLKSGHTSKEEYARLWNTILAGQTWTGEFLNVKKDGEYYWEEAIISPIKNKEGEIINFLAIKRDVTELKKINEELLTAKETAEEMSRLKSNFLANMSHELRTPMIGILGYSEMLLDEFPDEKVHEIGEIILQSGHRLMETLNLILDLSRIEAKKLEVQLSKVNLVAVSQDVAKFFGPAAEKKHLSLSFKTTLETLEIMLDEKMFREILNNLVNNAIKFTEHGGITIKLSREESGNNDWAVVQVADTGIGIANENFNMIFEEFRQASEGKSRSFEGTGLGLTITKRFVEKLKGSVNIESTLGIGTTFTVRFPIRTAEDFDTSRDNIAPRHNDAPIKAQLPQVLYVEDDEIAIHIVSTILAKHCEIDTAGNAETALRMAAKKNYDAILMDINLGKGMDGVKTTKLIKQMTQYANTPVVALTAYAMIGDKEEFLRAGCTHYLSKPFTKKELLALMSDVLPAIT
jgi:PAS domain S-box-containing protein